MVLEVPAADGFEDDALPEPREGWLLVRVHVEEMELFKCFQFPADRIIWDCKQQILASLPKVSPSITITIIMFLLDQ